MYPSVEYKREREMCFAASVREIQETEKKQSIIYLIESRTLVFLFFSVLFCFVFFLFLFFFFLFAEFRLSTLSIRLDFRLHGANSDES